MIRSEDIASYARPCRNEGEKSDKSEKQISYFFQ